MTRGVSAAAAPPVVPESSGVIDMILTDSIPPWLNLQTPTRTTSSADVVLLALNGPPAPATVRSLEPPQQGPLTWALLPTSPDSMSRSDYYNGAYGVPRSSTLRVGELGGSAAAPPGSTPIAAESSDRPHRYATLAAVAHSPRRHPIERAPMVGGVSPRGEPPWGTIGARERWGSGLGFGPGNPGPHPRLKQRHTARVQRPSGQTPRTQEAHTHRQDTQTHGT